MSKPAIEVSSAGFLDVMEKMIPASRLEALCAQHAPVARTGRTGNFGHAGAARGGGAETARSAARVADEPTAFFSRPDFNRGLAAPREHGFVYDLLIHERS